MRLKLLVKQRLAQGTTTQFLEVQRDHCVLGRKDADVLLNEPRCSRHHALFYVDRDGGLRIKDLESTNGTYLNGRRIRDAGLRAGDEIRVGQAAIVVVVAEADAGSAPPPTESWERINWTQDDTLTLQEAAQQWPAQFLCQPKERQTAFRDYVLGTGAPGNVRQHGGNSHDSQRGKQTSPGLGGGNSAVPGVR